jgi:hypothetical protein
LPIQLSKNLHMLRGLQKWRNIFLPISKNQKILPMLLNFQKLSWLTNSKLQLKKVPNFFFRFKCLYGQEWNITNDLNKWSISCCGNWSTQSFLQRLLYLKTFKFYFKRKLCTGSRKGCQWRCNKILISRINLIHNLLE